MPRFAAPHHYGTVLKPGTSPRHSAHTPGKPERARAMRRSAWHGRSPWRTAV